MKHKKKNKKKKGWSKLFWLAVIIPFVPPF